MRKYIYKINECCCLVVVGTSYSDCEFPRQWWGRWHQTGIGELVIRANEISTKGTCYEQYREYFLVENRWVDHILECLVCNSNASLFVKRHT